MSETSDEKPGRAVRSRRQPDEPRQEIQEPSRNPFAGSAELAVVQPVGALATAEAQKSVAEVQARMIIARANPRNQMACMDAIIRDCTRPSLATRALYQYARGGSSISGPSIRLAEAIAQRWGNIASGIKEVGRDRGYSECVAYAWDLETGYYDERQFQVRHWRDTKQGGYVLTDERDIYELIANMGQRRKRAVLLTVIPGDVVEAAVDQCEETLKANADTSPAALAKLTEAFAQFGVTRQQIEQRCQCRLEAIRPAQIVQLSKIYASLRDEMSSPRDWFDNNAWTEIQRRHDETAAVAKPSASATEQATAARDAAASRGVNRPRTSSVEGLGPTGGGSPSQDQPVQTGQATGASVAGAIPAASPSPEEVAAPVSSGGAAPEFSAWMLDQGGEPVELYSDPVAYADHMRTLYHHSGNKIGMLEQNADGIADAEAASAEAKAILDEFTESDAGSDEDVPEIAVVQIPLVRGKPDWKTYMADFKAALGQTTADTYLDWTATQYPTLTSVDRATRLHLVIAAVKHANALGVTVPTVIAAEAEAKPAGDKDEQSVINLIAELKDIQDPHLVTSWMSGMVKVALRDRLTREGKQPLVQRLLDAQAARLAELRGSA